jgi:hypothetical protein
MLFFWVLTPCRLVGRYQRFRETYCRQPGRWKQYVTSNRQNPEEQIVILTAVRTLYLAYSSLIHRRQHCLFNRQSVRFCENKDVLTHPGRDSSNTEIASSISRRGISCSFLHCPVLFSTGRNFGMVTSSVQGAQPLILREFLEPL